MKDEEITDGDGHKPKADTIELMLIDAAAAATAAQQPLVIVTYQETYLAVLMAGPLLERSCREENIAAHGAVKLTEEP